MDVGRVLFLNDQPALISVQLTPEKHGLPYSTQPSMSTQPVAPVPLNPAGHGPHEEPAPRGLHSSTFQLNLSTLSGTWDAFTGCLGVVQGVSGDVRGC